MPSAIYFPLRSNAKALIAGRSIALMRQRILRAAVLHDRVLLEDGAYVIHAGPSASRSFYHETPTGYRWQSPSTRARSQGSSFRVNIRPTSAPESAPFRTIMYSETEIAWRPTFIPFKAELPKAYRWLEFGHVTDDPSVKKEAWSLHNPDRKDPMLADLWPDGIVRKLMIQHTNIDLGMGALLGAAVGYDTAHAPVVLRKVHRGDGVFALGDRVLHVRFPADLSWQDADDLRRVRGMREFRAILREVESAARDSANSLDSLDEVILREYGDALSRAQARSPSVLAKVVIEIVAIGVGATASAATGVVAPGIGEVAGGVAGLALGEAADYLATPRDGSECISSSTLGTPSSG